MPGVQEKAVAKSIYSGARCDSWRTPDSLWNKLHGRYHFTCDLAASDENAKVKRNSAKNPGYFTESRSSLDVDWQKFITCWLNPPFSNAEPFFKKCDNARVVAIYKATNLETALWQDVILPMAAWVCFLRGRLNYANADNVVMRGVPFGSALIGFNVPSLVQDLGHVWRLREKVWRGNRRLRV